MKFMKGTEPNLSIIVKPEDRLTLHDNIHARRGWVTQPLRYTARPNNYGLYYKTARNPINTALFQPCSGTEFKGSLVSGFFKRDLFGLDTGDSCAVGKGIAGSNDIRCVSLGRLDNRLWRGFPVCRDASSDQTKRFFRACGAPAKRTEKVVINDGPVELGFLKEDFRFSALCWLRTFCCAPRRADPCCLVGRC